MSGFCWLRSFVNNHQSPWQSRSSPLKDKSHFRSLGLGINQFCLQPCPIKPCRPEWGPYKVMIQRVSSSCGQTSTVLQNSVLKKSQTVSLVIKFSKKSSVDFFGCRHVFRGQMSCRAIPANISCQMCLWVFISLFSIFCVIINCMHTQ